jgi:hypothetical protein
MATIGQGAGSGDILVFKEIIKKGDFSRPEQTGSMVIFLRRWS